MDTVQLEVIMAYGLIAWSWILLVIYPDLFVTGAFYAPLKQLADQQAWGLVFLATGLLQGLGILLNTKNIRALAAFFGAGLWGYVTTSFLLTNAVPTGIAIYGMFALASVLATYRNVKGMRSKDARKEGG